MAEVKPICLYNGKRKQLQSGDTLPISITTSTPTTISGLLKGNGSTVSAATAGTDYAAADHGVTNGNSHNHSSGDGGTITEAALSLSDNTTANVSTSKHGYCPKAPNDTAKFLRGDGTWATLPGGGSVLYSISYVAGNTSTWTAPAGVHMVYLSGGAGGGGGANGNQKSTSGGAGACCNRYPFRVVPGTGYDYYVGSGGAGGSSSPYNGSAGGNTFFGNLIMYGGSGGGTDGGNGGAFGCIPGKLGAVNNPAVGSNSDTYDVAICVGAGGGKGSYAAGSSPRYAAGSTPSANYPGGAASLYGAGGNGVAGTGGAGGLCAGGGAGTTGGAGGNGFLLIEYWVATAP